MKKTRLIQLVELLTEKEFEKWRLFLESPLFNLSPLTLRLYAFIAQHFHYLEADNFTKEATHHYVYQTDKYNDDRLRALMSDTAKLLQEFLTIRQIQLKEPLKQQLLLEVLDNRNAHKLFVKQSKSIQKDREQIPHRDDTFYADQQLLEESIYNFTIRKQDRSVSDSLKEMVGSMDTYYLAKRLKYSCEMLNRYNIHGDEFDFEYIDLLLPLVEKEPYNTIPVIAIYKQILLTLKDPDEEAHYSELKALLDQHSSLFPTDELKALYGFAMNYCIKRINSGYPEYLEEVFIHYKSLLASEAIFENKQLSQWDYKNIVTVGLRLKQTDWTRSFITDYLERLPKKDQKNALAYNQSSLNYHEGNYDEAIQLLQKIAFTDIFYSLDSRSILLKSYYELEEYEALFALIDSFSTYLRRNKKISPYQRKAYLNMVKCIRKLSRIRLERKNLTKRLEDDILNRKPLADSTWIKEKITSLNPVIA